MTRRTDERDERALVIALTPEGVALRERAVEIPGQMLERLGLDLADVERVRDSAQLMLDACERAG